MEQYNIIDILVHIFTKLEDDVKKVALGAISKILEAGRDQYAPKIKDAGLVQIIWDLAGKFPQDTDLILAYFDQWKSRWDYEVKINGCIHLFISLKIEFQVLPRK